MKSFLDLLANTRDNLKGQDWGIAAAADDIRHKVIEEGWYLRPAGREVTGDISTQPSPMQSLYQSHLPASQGLEQSKDIEQQDLYGKDIEMER